MPTAAQQHYARSVVAQRKAKKAREAEVTALIASAANAEEIIAPLLELAKR